MFSTFERELIANQRQQELLQTIVEQDRFARASATERRTSLIATLTARLFGTAIEGQIATPTTARA